MRLELELGGLKLLFQKKLKQIIIHPHHVFSELLLYF